MYPRLLRPLVALKLSLVLALLTAAAPAFAFDSTKPSFLSATGEALIPPNGPLQVEMVTGMFGAITVPANPPHDGQYVSYWIGVEDFGHETWVVQALLAWNPSGNRWEIYPEYYNTTHMQDQQGTHITVHAGDTIAVEVDNLSINTSACSDSWDVDVFDYDTNGHAYKEYDGVPCTIPGQPESGNSFTVTQEFHNVASCADTPSASFDSVTVWYGDGIHTQFNNYPFDNTTAYTAPQNLPNLSCGYNTTIGAPGAQTCDFAN